VPGIQPFFTAELYTGQPGEYVPLATALADYAGLADGRYAERTIESITFIGSLEAGGR
jgi:F0F1-type ATP synthase beta subunit